MCSSLLGMKRVKPVKDSGGTAPLKLTFFSLHFSPPVSVIKHSLSILLPVKERCTDTGSHFVPVFPWSLIDEQMSRDESQDGVLAGRKHPGFLNNK